MNYKMLLKYKLIEKVDGLYTLTTHGMNFAVFCLLSKTYAEEFPECINQQPDESHTQYIFDVLVRKGLLYEDRINFTDSGGKKLWEILEELTEDDFVDLIMDVNNDN